MNVPRLAAVGCLLIVSSCSLIGCGEDNSARAQKAGNKAEAAAPTDDIGQWQGTWKVVATSYDGAPQAGDVQWVVEGDRYRIRLDGKLHQDPHMIMLDARSKRIDVFHHEVPKGTYGGSLKGIYEIKENRLRVTYDLTNRQYPTSFETKMGSRLVSYEFERVTSAQEQARAAPNKK